MNPSNQGVGSQLSSAAEWSDNTEIQALAENGIANLVRAAVEIEAQSQTRFIQGIQHYFLTKFKESIEENQRSQSHAEPRLLGSEQESCKKRKRDSTFSTKPSKREWASITLPISESCSANDLTRIREEFYDELVIELQTNRMTEDKSREMTEHAAEQMAAIFTSFFFEKGMGPSSLDRLFRFCEQYAREAENEFDAAAEKRLKCLSADETVPEEIRKFYSALQSQEYQCVDSIPLIRHLDQLISAQKFLAAHRSLQESLTNRDRDLVAFLTKRGYSATGRGWASHAVDFLVEAAGVNRQAFLNSCQRAKGVDELVKQFGEGILPLLPRGSMNKYDTVSATFTSAIGTDEIRLRRFGNKRIKPAYELLGKRAACFQPICSLVKEHIYDGFVSSVDRLPISTRTLKTLKSVPGVPFQQILETAIDDFQEA